MRHRWAAIRRLASLEDLKTIQIIALHEGIFGPLHPRAKQRIAQAASDRGWDRTWEDVALIA
jgi:hypothetical protein